MGWLIKFMYMYISSYPVSTASFFLHVVAKKKAGSGDWERGYMYMYRISSIPTRTEWDIFLTAVQV